MISHSGLVFVLAGLLVACGGGGGGSGSAGGTGGAGSTSTTGPGSTGTGSTPGCTVTFGGDAASVKAKNCTLMGPYTSDSTVFSFHGDADGLNAPIYAFSIKYPNGITAKKYETKDLYYISANIGVKQTMKNYFVDFDSKDASKQRDGSCTTVFTSPEHGTIDIVYDSDDMPPAHATAHVTF